MKKEHYYGFFSYLELHSGAFVKYHHFVERLKDDGFKLVINEHIGDKFFCLAKHNKKFSIEELKDRTEAGLDREKRNFIGRVIFSSPEENKEDFKKSMDYIKWQKTINNAFFSEVFVEKDHYCSCVVKHSFIGRMPIEQHAAFIGNMKKLGLTIVFNQAECFLGTETLKNNLRSLKEVCDIYEDSKEKAKVENLFSTGRPSYYLLQQEDAGAIDNLKKISFEGKSGFDLPEFVVHLRKTYPLVIEKEIESFVPREVVIDQLARMIA